MTSPRIATVIVNYGAADLVLGAIGETIAQTRAFPGSRIFIIDNASPGNDAARLETFAASPAAEGVVTFIASPHNGGFASGNNIAFAEIRRLHPRPDYIFLLNPDAILLPGALAALAELLDARPEAGVVGAQLESPDGAPQHAAFYFPALMRELAAGAGAGFLLKLWPMVLPLTAAAPRRVDWVTGAAMMFRAALLDRPGDMDDGFFLYFEETDYQRQATSLGWQVWQTPAARVAHAAGATTGLQGGRPRSGPMPAYWHASWLRYFVKNRGLAYARAAAGARLTGAALYRAHRRLRGREVVSPPSFGRDFAKICLFGPPPADLRKGAARRRGRAIASVGGED